VLWLALRVADDDAQYTCVDEEEHDAGDPQAWDEGRVPVELELEALLQPGELAYDPES